MVDQRPNIHESQHPLIKLKLTELRDKKSDPKRFRELVKECGSLLGYEATAQLKVNPVQNCQGELSAYTGHQICDKVALVPILRAGLGLVDSFLELLPSASVFHLGIYRDKMSLRPVEYYNKLPINQPADICLVLDPMLATGGTAIAAINVLKEWGVKDIKLVSICGSDFGVKAVVAAHPDVQVFIGVIDKELDSKGYIIPGLGDAGDRLFNTHA